MSPMSGPGAAVPAAARGGAMLAARAGGSCTHTLTHAANTASTPRPFSRLNIIAVAVAHLPAMRPPTPPLPSSPAARACLLLRVHASRPRAHFPRAGAAAAAVHSPGTSCITAAPRPKAHRRVIPARVCLAPPPPPAPSGACSLCGMVESTLHRLFLVLLVSSHPQKAKTKRVILRYLRKALCACDSGTTIEPRHSWSRRTCPRSGKPTPTRGREIRAASRHNLRRADAGCGTELPQLPARPVRGTGIQIQPKPRGGPGIWIRARRHLGVRTRPLLPESARGRRPGALRRRSPHAQRLSERAGGQSHTACRVGGAGRRGRTGRRGWRA